MIVVMMVDRQMEGFTKRKYKVAIRARQNLDLVGFPYRNYFKSMVNSNLITHCGVIVANIKVAIIIFGTNFPSLRGKMVRNKLTATTTDYL